MLEVNHATCEQYEAFLQSGSGIHVYSGTIVQQGYGVGGLFRRLASGLLPLLPTIVKADLGVASDKLSGVPLSRALKTRCLQAGKEVLLRSTRKTPKKAVKKRSHTVGRRIRKSYVFGSI